MGAEQLPFAVQGEGAAVQEGGHPGRVRGLGRVHRADEEPEVGEVGEVGEAHPARGEEDAGAEGGERGGGLVQGGDLVPRVAGSRHPAGPADGEQGNMGGGGGMGRTATDRVGERMGGVDERVHRVLAQPAGEALGAAEPSDAYLPGRQPGRGDPAGERGRHAQGRLRCQAGGQAAGLRRTAEDQYVARRASCVGHGMWVPPWLKRNRRVRARPPEGVARSSHTPGCGTAGRPVPVRRRRARPRTRRCSAASSRTR